MDWLTVTINWTEFGTSSPLEFLAIMSAIVWAFHSYGVVSDIFALGAVHLLANFNHILRGTEAEAIVWTEGKKAQEYSSINGLMRRHLAPECSTVLRSL